MANLRGLARQEHVLSRIGWGFRPDERDRYQELGHRGYIEQQLDLGGDKGGALAPLDPFPSNFDDLSNDPVVRAHKAAAIMMERAISQQRQLPLVLSDLFFNHLNVFAAMGVAAKTIDRYINDAIEANVLGTFDDMLLASAKQPAMLQYLDNRTNAVGATNENYGRELLELHTVGIGNHDEADVQSATRVLTGWTHIGLDAGAQWHFDPDRHDMGSGKLVLGVDYSVIGDAEGGEQEIIRLLHDLALHPATADRIAAKLFIRFIGEAEVAKSSAVVARMANTYLTSGSDLQQTLRNLLLSSGTFTSAETFRARVKPPHRLVISAFRAFNVTPTLSTLRNLAATMSAAGDQPYYYGPPTGYPDDSGYWLTGNAMLLGFRLADDIAAQPDIIAAAIEVGQLNQADAPIVTVQRLYRHLFMGGLAEYAGKKGFPRGSLRWSTVRAAHDRCRDAATIDDRVQAALSILLSSPEFRRY